MNKKQNYLKVIKSQANKDIINRLNNSLNIQWVFDIQSQFPASAQTHSLSGNVDEWINEIADEDDRKDILS